MTSPLIQNYYSVGTASVANGATAVTGVGTQWLAVLSPGDMFAANGLSVRIASITDNTHMTLAYNWPGTTLSGAAYDVRIAPPSADLTMALRSVLSSVSALYGLNASTLLGNPTGSSADAEVISLGTNLTFSGTALQVVDAPSFSGTSLSLGPNDTSSTNATLNLRGGNASGHGALISFQRNSTQNGMIGDAAGVLGGTTTTTDLVYYGTGTNAHRFYVNATERARVSSTGFSVTGSTVLTGSLSVTGSTVLTGSLSVSTTLSVTGHVTVEGVTSTGATGTGKFVFDTSPNFTGAVGIGMSPTNVLDITKNQNAGSTVSVLNNNASTAAYSSILLTNGTHSGQLINYGTGYTTSGIARQDGTMLSASGAGGLTVATVASQPIYFAVNSVEIARLTSGGLGINGAPATQLFTISGASVATTSSNPAGIRIIDTGNSSAVQLVNRTGTLQGNTPTGSGYQWCINNTVVAAIDSSGRSTVTNQPRFHAYRAADTGLLTGSYNTIAFDTEVYDIGNNYNTTNGRFTAPVTGLYHFDMSIGLAGFSDNQEFEMMFETAAATYYTFFTAHSLGWGSRGNAPGSIDIYLNAGDWVQVKIFVGGSATLAGGFTSAHSFFSGHLVC